MNPRLRKLIGDLVGTSSRSAFVFLSIAVGAATILSALGARSILQREIANGYASASPAAGIVTLDQDVTESVLEAVEDIPGVLAADSRRLVRARVEVAPGDWRPLLMFGVRDFSDMRVSKIDFVSGSQNPGRGKALVEQSALPVLGADTGDSLKVRLPGGHITKLEVSGVVHDPALAPGWQDNMGYVYVSPETLEAVGLSGTLNEVRITSRPGLAEARSATAEVVNRLSHEGYQVMRSEVLSRKHPHADHMHTMLLLLTFFGALALMISGTLTTTVVSGIVMRQTREIGVMKAIGGTRGQIAQIYASYLMTLVLPAVALGLWAGAAVARWFSRFASLQLNLEPRNWDISLATFGLAVLLSLAVPLIAAVIPIGKASRLRVREALQDNGLAETGPRCPTKPSSNRVLAYSLRNTLRRPLRTLLSLSALAWGGAALMTGLNVHRSLVAAVDGALGQRSDNLDMRFLKPVDTSALMARVAALPGVERVETWGALLASFELEGNPGLGSDRYGVLAPPIDSPMLEFSLAEGSYPQGMGEVAINKPLLARQPQLTVGRTVNLLANGRSIEVHIVGIIEELAPPQMYVTTSGYDELIGRSGTAGALRVTAGEGMEATIASKIEEVLVELGSLPVFAMTRSTLRTSMVDHFSILLALLSAASIAALLVGAMGLTATMALNAMERRREIGVLKAIGAPRATLIRLLVSEGGFISLVAFVTAIVISLPLSWLVGKVVGHHGLHLRLPFAVEPSGILLWALVAVIVTLAATVGPARNAIRLPVTRVLAYD